MRRGRSACLGPPCPGLAVNGLAMDQRTALEVPVTTEAVDQPTDD